ncbi:MULTISPECIES: cell division protein FtsZ [Devosia]|uniref:Cell division protein FtsZ n=1 Tax=Devosia equisanguinis TaxID=2490941 RepID=A0A447ID64_9HYPH|nr:MULTISPECIES: cell division protein FtsZ [Devosia]ODT50633.1 MAG: cell division protein FtsZ [Pelagibacterium sp. SCN 63-126]ODU85314.1 MAG: cell division protein FtsZ [Pelagibacterium sp. SCN 63-17]OJX45419.1 MAG: cell division protein FtsZ [Devosia sp. 63-57]VDS05411.1 Cell division protein FtsZ [Devosia equisanguinis]
MTINLTIPDIQELKPRITVFGVGGGGGNAVNNMIESGLDGVDFVVANTDAQALSLSKAQRIIQLGVGVTEGLGAGSHPEVGRAAAEESWDEINDHLSGSHMVFITAGMGGGTGTGAAPVVARAAREQGILTVGVVTKPFNFEGNRRSRLAEDGIDELHRHVDTLIVIPNQNLFRVANEKTTFADAFAMADQVLFSGVACITDLMVKEGLINLDFADVRAVMRGMGKAMMGTGEASGEDRARHAAEAAIANPLLDDVSMHGARGLLISITGGPDLTLYEVDEAASRIREEVDVDANIILGATYDPNLNGTIRVSVVATGTDATMVQALEPAKPHASRTPLSVKRHVPVEPTRSVVPPAPEPVIAEVEEIGQQVEAAVAEAFAAQRPLQQSMLEDDGVFVEPYTPAAEIHHEPEEVQMVEEQPIPSVYVPSHAARPEGQRRMPRTEELPAVARRTQDAQERHEAEPRNARALFKRLASNVGLNLGQQAAETRQEPRTSTADDAAARSAIEAGGARASRVPPASEGARGTLDNQGRQPAQPQQKDHLEIPAFLRKHG